jgi:D-sedoheptulose 7-phosphate isomerase
MKTFYSEYFNKLNKTLTCLDESKINQLFIWLLDAYNTSSNIFIFGNGGSGANASHIAGDYVKGASYGLENRFRMLCLNDNMSALMAISNDIGYEYVFKEQLCNFLQPEDLVIGFSGSGNSANIIEAMQYAKQNSARTVGVCGYSGGKLKHEVDLVIHAEIDDMEIAEDLQLIVFHAIKQKLIAILHDGASMGKKYDARISGVKE